MYSYKIKNNNIKMDMYTQIQYQTEQLMMYQAMQLQQQSMFYNSYLGQQMEEPAEDSKQGVKGKRGYVQWELWKRQSLVEKVENEGLTIKDAAKELDINYSTAKHIMKVYRQSGEVETKIMMKRKTKGSSSQENFTEWDVGMDHQMNIQNLPQANPCYYGYNLNDCQLPIDEKMQDVNFEAERFDDETKENIHCFLFSNNSCFQ